MNLKKIGLIIFIIGLSIIIYTGFNYITRKKVVNKSYVQITINEDHISDWPPFVGIGIIVFTGFILLFGTRRNPD